MEKFKAPAWCKLKHKGIRKAILGAAERVGAQVYMSASFQFPIDQFERVEQHFRKHGKEGVSQAIVDYVDSFGKRENVS